MKNKTMQAMRSVNFVNKIAGIIPFNVFSRSLRGYGASAQTLGLISSSTTPPSSSSSSSSSSWLLPHDDPLDAVERPFRLSKTFVNRFAEVQPPFGFNGLGELVYRRTYSRVLSDGSHEEWYQTVERVVNGTFNMQKRWIEMHRLGWNSRTSQRSAQEMYRRIFHMKFLPPGRGLWAMGSALTEERGLYAALNNCAFVSTYSIKEDAAKPFCFLMDASMLGVGVGFDTKGAGSLMVQGVDQTKPAQTYVIDDSREGWVEAIRRLLLSYFFGGPLQVYDYSLIRKQGEPIRGFGGVASGPGALATLVTDISAVLDRHIGKPLSETGIVDIMNYIGKCVVAGNVRRTAEIAFGDPTSIEYLDLKNYEVNPDRAAYGWTSNNSVYAEIGMNYGAICDRIRLNGEPGLAWLDNMRQYSRMGDEKNYKDERASGGNPCLEQTLESYELCCLVETFPNNHESLADFIMTLRYAYLYAKSVTLGKTHWPETNRVLLRNRRIGCSMSGIAQFITKNGLDTFREWSECGYEHIQKYDKEYSEWFAIPRSIKTTSVKPSGTVSLLAGATPGVHFPESRFYIRRMRLSQNSDLLKPLRDANYTIEPAVGQPDTVVVEIPVDVGEGIRTLKDITMWEQLSLAAFLQRYWADNQVSATISFDPEKEGGQLEHALAYFQYQLKGVSFLPRVKAGAYPQMPYEEIDEKTYRERISVLKRLVLRNSKRSREDFVVDRFCDGESCSI